MKISYKPSIWSLLLPGVLFVSSYVMADWSHNGAWVLTETGVSAGETPWVLSVKKVSNGSFAISGVNTAGKCADGSPRVIDLSTRIYLASDPNVELRVSSIVLGSNSGIVDVVFPPSLNTVSANFLTKCTTITNLILHSAITAIGNSALSNCSSLKEIFPRVFPSVKSIGSQAFYNCAVTGTLTFAGAKVSLDISALRKTGLRRIAFPKGTSGTLTDYCLAENTKLEELQLGPGVTIIATGKVFYNDSKLTKVWMDNYPSSTATFSMPAGNYKVTFWANPADALWTANCTPWSELSSAVKANWQGQKPPWGLSKANPPNQWIAKNASDKYLRIYIR